MKIADDVLDWLLEATNPPVRYLTLTRLLDRPETDPEVRVTRDRLMEYPVTQAILHHPRSLPLDDERPYWKYSGLYWQLIGLGRFLADGRDPRIARAVEFVLEHRHWIQKGRWQCLTANLLGAMLRLGYADHPAVLKETEALARRILNEDGIDCSVSIKNGCGGKPNASRNPLISPLLGWYIKPQMTDTTTIEVIVGMRMIVRIAPTPLKGWRTSSANISANAI